MRRLLYKQFGVKALYDGGLQVRASLDTRLQNFAVSALREGVAPKGVKIPVSFLAKWKTALQMVAIGAELLVGSWAAWGLPSEPEVLGNATNTAHVLLWIAAIITVWTGAEYWHKAHVQIGDN